MTPAIGVNGQKRKQDDDNSPENDTCEINTIETLRLSCLDTLHDFGKSSTYRSTIIELINTMLEEKNTIEMFFGSNKKAKDAFILKLVKNKATGFEHEEYDNIKIIEKNKKCIKNSITSLENNDIIKTIGNEPKISKFVIDRGSKTSCETQGIKYTFASWFDNAGCNKDPKIQYIKESIEILKKKGELLMLESIKGTLLKSEDKDKLTNFNMLINGKVIDADLFYKLRPEVKKYSDVIFDITTNPAEKEKYEELFTKIEGLPSKSISNFTSGQKKAMILMDLKRAGDTLQIASVEKENFFVTGDYMAAAIGLHKKKNVVMTYMGDKRKNPEQEHRNKKADVFTFYDDIKLDGSIESDKLSNEISRLRNAIQNKNDEIDSFKEQVAKNTEIYENKKIRLAVDNPRSKAGFIKLIAELKKTSDATLKEKETKLKSLRDKLKDKEKEKLKEKLKEEPSNKKAKKITNSGRASLNDSTNMSQQGGNGNGDSVLFEQINKLFLSQHNNYYHNDIKHEIETAIIVQDFLFNFTNYGDYVDIFDPIMSLQGLVCMRYILGTDKDTDINMKSTVDNIDIIDYNDINIILGDIKKWHNKGILEELYKRVVYLHYRFLNQHSDYTNKAIYHPKSKYINKADFNYTIDIHSLFDTDAFFAKKPTTSVKYEKKQKIIEGLLKELMPELEDILTYTIVFYERIKNAYEKIKSTVRVNVTNFQDIIISLDKLKNTTSNNKNIPVVDPPVAPTRQLPANIPEQSLYNTRNPSPIRASPTRPAPRARAPHPSPIRAPARLPAPAPAPLAYNTRDPSPVRNPAPVFDTLKIDEELEPELRKK